MRYIVGQAEGVKQPVRLGSFTDEEMARAFLASLPGVEDGRYYFDECGEPLTNREPKRSAGHFWCPKCDGQLVDPAPSDDIWYHIFGERNGCGWTL